MIFKMSTKSNDSWVRIIDVSNPVLHKKGYTLYKVTSKVFPKNSVEAVTEVTVWKRYNDFKKLHKALSNLHQNLYLKGIFPPFAKTKFFGRFDPVIIEERRESALKLLNFAANYSPLFTSQVFVKFFEDSQAMPSEDKQTHKHAHQNSESFLQPQKCLSSTDLLDSSLHKSDNDNCLNFNDIGLTEPVSPLSGIWQHHQVSDNISLTSGCTDDDDNTTFTDDDSITSRPSVNMSEFDPLMQIDSNSISQNDGPCDQDTMCNTWLLSALRTCSVSDSERDLETILEFPAPFGDCDVSDDTVLSLKKNLNVIEMEKDSNGSYFTFDMPVTDTSKCPDISEFDPLTETDSEAKNYDDFAMTPGAHSNTTQRRPSYMSEATKYVTNAKEFEEAFKYLEAFESYKKAIDVLLHGFQKDKCEDLKDVVRKKVLLYLMRAEELYENKLPKTSNVEKSKVLPLVKTIPIQPANFKSSLYGSIPELNQYKVLGIVDKVLLVLDISSNSTYVVKTLYKSSSPQKPLKANIFPQSLPFVVKLHRVYETSYALFLILEHAPGGRLWDYVSSFLQRSPLTQDAGDILLYVDPKRHCKQLNVYSGKKTLDDNDDMDNSNQSSDSDLTPSKKCPPSYIALFKKYADSVGMEEKVSLAKYHKFQQRPFTDDNSQGLLQHHQKNFRCRLASSTGSLETLGAQKSCLFEFANGGDETTLQSHPKTLLSEFCVVIWAAELVIALEYLHNLGMICMDLHPKNILLGAEGNILLSYQSQWNNVDFVVDEVAKESLFCAPEVGQIFPVTSDCDWWSLGAILFELLTGYPLVFCHPAGITCHTILNFPADISSEAKDLLTKLLQYNPTERLGSGIYGVEEIKCHPFFHNVNWESICK